MPNWRSFDDPANFGSAIAFPDARTRIVVLNVSAVQYPVPFWVRFIDGGTLHKVDGLPYSITTRCDQVRLYPSSSALPPESLTATALSQTAIEVDWTFSDLYDADRIELYRSTTAGGPYTIIDTVDVDARPYTDDDGGAGLASGTTYFYRAKGVLRGADDPVSAFNDTEVSVTTASGTPGTPTGLTVTETGRTANSITVDITWTPGANTDSSDWWIEQGADGTGYSNGSSALPNNTTGSSVIGLVISRINADDLSDLKVRGRNAGGVGPVASQAFTIPGNLKPPSFDSLTLVNVNDAQGTFTEDPDTDVADDYRVERDSGSGFSEILTVGLGVQSFNDPNLPDGGHTYRIRARDGVLFSAYSSARSVFVGSGNPVPPGPNLPGHMSLAVSGTNIGSTTWDSEAAMEADGWGTGLDKTGPLVGGGSYKNPEVVASPHAGFPSGLVMRHTWREGHGDDAVLPGTRGTSGGTRYGWEYLAVTEIYCSWWVMYDTRYRNSSGNHKMTGIGNNWGGRQACWFRASGDASGSPLSLRWDVNAKTSEGPLVADTKSTIYTQNQGVSDRIVLGQPHQVEVYLKQNTQGFVAGDPAADGQIKMWLNGVLTLDTNHSFWTATADPGTRTFAGFVQDPIVGGRSPAPEAHMWMDNIFIAIP